MTKYIMAAGTLLVVALCPATARGQIPATPRKIEILFLGHNSPHHNSSKFEPMLKDALASEPFQFTYTADPKDLNDANLAKYDELMIYANHIKIEPEQEKALLDFVAGGKGFLPLHSASFCFQNSPAYIALVGAQFQRHKTGEFVTDIVKPDHQVMLGIQPFQVWDETYVHSKHNNDRTVLMERVDETGREPWTWVRMHGKGRVFYTAYGHDERVWGHPSFHRLVRNAIFWAVPSGMRAQLKLAPGQEFAAAISRFRDERYIQDRLWLKQSIAAGYSLGRRLQPGADAEPADPGSSASISPGRSVPLRRLLALNHARAADEAVVEPMKMKRSRKVVVGDEETLPLLSKD